MYAVAGLEDTRILVVGASSGIGQAVGRAAVDSGARVVLAARRLHLLQQLVAEAGGGTAFAVDLTDPRQCRALATMCRAELGEIDLVVNATGISLLRRIDETSADDWDHIIRTNVIGCNELIRSVVDLLSPASIITTLSSEAVTRPRAGLGAYTASKAALEASLAAWRHERAPIRFACVAIGPTMPTDVSNDFDPDVLATMLGDWLSTGMMQTTAMATDDVGRALLGVLASVLPYPEVNLEHVLLRSPSAVVGSVAAPPP